MRWVLVTQTTKNAFFFEKFYRGHDPPHPQSCLYTPPVETPAPAHPDRLHSTGSRAGRARTRADKYQGIPPPKRWTRCTGLHSIPDRPRRADRNGGGVLEVVECVRNCADMDNAILPFCARKTNQKNLIFLFKRY